MKLWVEQGHAIEAKHTVNTGHELGRLRPVRSDKPVACICAGLTWAVLEGLTNQTVVNSAWHMTATLSGAQEAKGIKPLQDYRLNGSQQQTLQHTRIK